MTSEVKRVTVLCYDKRLHDNSFTIKAGKRIKRVIRPLTLKTLSFTSDQANETSVQGVKHLISECNLLISL